MKEKTTLRREALASEELSFSGFVSISKLSALIVLNQSIISAIVVIFNSTLVETF